MCLGACIIRTLFMQRTLHLVKVVPTGLIKRCEDDRVHESGGSWEWIMGMDHGNES